MRYNIGKKDSLQFLVNWVGYEEITGKLGVMFVILSLDIIFEKNIQIKNFKS